jgi:hypothetical protein
METKTLEQLKLDLAEIALEKDQLEEAHDRQITQLDAKRKDCIAQIKTIDSGFRYEVGVYSWGELKFYGFKNIEAAKIEQMDFLYSYAGEKGYFTLVTDDPTAATVYRWFSRFEVKIVSTDQIDATKAAMVEEFDSPASNPNKRSKAIVIADNGNVIVVG